MSESIAPDKVLAVLAELDALRGDPLLEGTSGAVTEEGRPLLHRAIAGLEAALGNPPADNEQSYPLWPHLERVELVRQELAARLAQVGQLERILSDRRRWVGESRALIREVKRATREAEAQAEQLRSLLIAGPREDDQREMELLEEIDQLGQGLQRKRKEAQEALASELEAAAEQSPALHEAATALLAQLDQARRQFPLGDEGRDLAATRKLLRGAVARLAAERERLLAAGPALSPQVAELLGQEERLRWLEGERQARARAIVRIKERVRSLAEECEAQEANVERQPAGTLGSAVVEAEAERVAWLEGEVAGRKRLADMLEVQLDDLSARLQQAASELELLHRRQQGLPSLAGEEE